MSDTGGAHASYEDNGFNQSADIFTQEMMVAYGRLSGESQNPETIEMNMCDFTTEEPTNIASPHSEGSFHAHRNSLPAHCGRVGYTPISAGKASHMPALRDIRAMISASSNRAMSKGSPTPEAAEAQDGSNDTFMAALSRFLSTVPKTHSEIAGISSKVAEHLRWVRMGPEVSKLSQIRVLETLEMRITEIRDVAENSHLEAWGLLMASMSQSKGWLAQMELTEDEMRRNAAETSATFREDCYDICVSLSEQRSATTGQLDGS
ncbi:hypothetical protein F5Y15DRAFT_416943 [Xylariaceae sp. FL0016]|nr:hypothetical protein F5Y15DRAFT_416943 [Xylariaceae sp. FL0016]